MTDRDDPRPIALQTSADISRRDALKLLTATLASAQVACLEPPGDEVRPYVRTPADVTPGTPRYYATAMVLDGFATGLIVESHEGKPTKVEGNPEHPASLGASSAEHQASVLDLYDPCRAKLVTHGGQPSSWSALAHELARAPRPLWLVVPPSSSPLEAALMSELFAHHADTRVVVVGDGETQSAYAGAELAFGRAHELQLDFSRAEVVVALDADLFSRTPMSLRWARDFAQRRRQNSPLERPQRLYAVEPMLTPTGTLADHRVPLRAGGVLEFLLALAHELSARGVPLPALPALQHSAQGHKAALSAMAEDLSRAAGASILAVGERQPPECHALAHLLNGALGNVGATVSFTDPVLTTAPGAATLPELAAALHARQVGTLAILDCNPVQTAPPELGLSGLLRNAPLSIHLDHYRNETSAACDFHAPLSHYLESWGDARSRDGTHSLVQPLIRPLHATRDKAQLLAMLAGQPHPRSLELLRSSFRQRGESAAAFEARFQAALALGFVRGSAFAAVPLGAPGVPSTLHRALTTAAQPRALAPDRIEVNLAQSPTVRNERASNNAWLQELPHPVTKQTWGNAALISHDMAERLALRDGQVLRLSRAGAKLELPVLCAVGHAPDCITIELGYGRTSSEEAIARGVGENAARLTSSPGERILPAVYIARTERHQTLARSQSEASQHGRSLAPAFTPEGLARQDELSRLQCEEPTSLPESVREGPQWAMTIDTSVCSGCSACVIACQSENNVPVVGKAEVQRGREMHWLRIDTYLVPHGREVRVVNQPMMCQHCEHAPCEYVCPVFATEHSPDGLNEMTYNRCIGTRFCQANCPYKVRRFNWRNYTEAQGTLALQRNPEVSVRDRGVMEKCTYCVQRIRREEYKARMERRPVDPSRVITACAQACPTQAIRFGALGDPASPMQRERQSARAYGVLHELGTRPRTIYLAKLYRPHPALGEEA